MLNAKALSDLLTKNVHPTISPRWFVMTPNATLLAYSTTNNVKELRDQAALLSMLWKEHSSTSSTPGQQPSQQQKRDLETLTIEFPEGNIIVRAVQAQLLLVLVGGTWAPGEADRGRFRVTAEGRGEAKFSAGASSGGEKLAAGEGSDPVSKDGADGDVEAMTSSPTAAGASEEDEELRVGLLLAQRGKIDAATEHLRGDFALKGFVMPGMGRRRPCERVLCMLLCLLGVRVKFAFLASALMLTCAVYLIVWY